MSLRCSAKIICFLFFNILILTFSAHAGEGRITKAFETTYDFDKDSKLVSEHKPDGNEIKYVYDEKGQLKQVKSPEGTTSIIYDAVGNCIGVKNEDGETTYSYDASNRIKSAKFKYDSLVKEINYDYDPWGRISETKILSEKGSREHYMRYSYDIVGRVSSIETNHRKITYQYDPIDLKIIRTLPNGVKTIFSYQDNGLLKSIDHLGSNGTTLARFEYTYRLDGLLSQTSETIEDSNFIIHYEYDKVDRLFSAHYSDGRVYRYQYDSIGNRTLVESPHGSLKSRYDWTGRLVRCGNKIFSYDLNGNMVSQKGAQERISFSYNSVDQLVSVHGGNHKTEYQYSAEGLLNYRSTEKHSTSYVADPRFFEWRPLAAYHSDGSVDFYIWAGHGLGRVAKGRLEFYLEDRLGSVRLVVDSEGNVLKTCSYSPFGVSDSPSRENSLLPGFAGLFYEPRLNLFLTCARAYDPMLGRFLQQDPYFQVPSGSQKDISSYVYCGNDPVNFVDGTGLAAQPVISPHSVGLFDIKGGVQLGLEWIQQKVVRNFTAMDGRGDRGLLRAGGWAANFGWEFLGSAFQYSADRWNLVQTAAESWGTRSVNPEAVSLGRAWKDTALATFGVATTVAPFMKSLKPLVGFEALAVKGMAQTGTLATGKAPIIAKQIKLLRGLRDAVGLAQTAAQAGKAWGEFGGGISSFTRDDLKVAGRSPFKDIERELQPKGVRFDRPAKLIGHIGSIKGFSFDRQTGKFYLVGDTSIEMPPLRKDDLALAIDIVYSNDPLEPQHPTFSLDPYDPMNPNGQWLKPVYRPRALEGSHMGDLMFKADWLLKQYTFGARADDKGNIIGEIESSVPGYKSYLELASMYPPQSGEVWSRFWILPLDMILSRSGNMLTFEKATMQVKTCRMDASGGGLVDTPYQKDNVANYFSKFFTESYDEFAKESPALEELRQVAKVVAIVKWLKEKDVRVDEFDLDWLEECSQEGHKSEGIGRIKTLNRGTATAWGWINIVGGVELAPIIVSSTDYGVARNFEQALKEGPLESASSAITEVNIGGDKYRIATIPATSWGRRFCKEHPVTVIDDITYCGDREGRVRKALDRYGNSLAYDYDEEGKLNKIEFSSRDRWRILASRDMNGTNFMLQSPTRHLLDYQFDHEGSLDRINIDGKLFAKFRYEGDSIDVAYYESIEKLIREGLQYKRIKKDEITFREHITFCPDNKDRIIKYVRTDVKNGRTETISFEYPVNNSVVITGQSIGSLRILQLAEKSLLESPQGRIQWFFEDDLLKKMVISDDDYLEFFHTEKASEKGNILSRIIAKKGEKKAEISYEKDLVKVINFSGGISKYTYSKGRLISIADPMGNTIHYNYDKAGKLQKVTLPGRRYLCFNWKNYPVAISSGVNRSLTTRLEGTPEKPLIVEYKDPALQKRLDDDLRASKNLKNGLIIDLFVGDQEIVYGNIVDCSGNVKKFPPEATKELRHLIKSTVHTKTKLGEQFLKRWDSFYNTHLKLLNKPTYWNSPDGKLIKLKPVLIIKSNEVNYKYANLEKVPVLADNFIIFIASKQQEGKDVAETTAEELTRKIKDIPKLSKENVFFAIRPPRRGVTMEMQKKWEETIIKLEEVVGRDNVLFNPSRDKFTRMLNNRGKEIIVIELTHTTEGIALNGNEIYNSTDILKSGDLSHIKYLIAGNSCSLPQLQKGEIAAAFRKKGVGIMNTSYRKIFDETVLKRLRELIRILENIDVYDFPAYYLPDIIDQLIDDPDPERKSGTTNLGKLEFHKWQFLS